MKVQDVVTKAKNHIRKLYSDENIRYVGLEEVDLDDDTWKITIGFARPWDMPPMSPLSPLSPALEQLIKPRRPVSRTYKLVIVRDSDGEILSVKHRDLIAS